jgi:hypothetical protein
MAIAACCRPTVPCTSTAIGLPSTFAYACDMATGRFLVAAGDELGSGVVPVVDDRLVDAAELEPGLAATYSRLSALSTSTMKSPPGRSVVTMSTSRRRIVFARRDRRTCGGDCSGRLRRGLCADACGASNQGCASDRCALQEIPTINGSVLRHLTLLGGPEGPPLRSS